MTGARDVPVTAVSTCAVGHLHLRVRHLEGQGWWWALCVDPDAAEIGVVSGPVTTELAGDLRLAAAMIDGCLHGCDTPEVEG